MRTVVPAELCCRIQRPREWMTRKWKHPSWKILAVSFLSLAGCTGLILSNRSRQDRFAFLQGHPKLDEGVGAAMEHAGPYPGRPIEFRLYSWPEEFNLIAQQVEQELKPLGYALDTQSDSDYRFWRKKGAVEIMLMAEKSDPASPGYKSIYGGEPNPGWVTIYAINPAGNDWISKTRVALFAR